MLYSKLFPKTIKNGKKYESVNATYLINGGFIDQLMSGSYSLLPLGKRVESKIVKIIREEMNSTGAQEVLMPLLHPKEIWNETGRWESAAEVMYQFKKNDKEYALSFTHEEIVMDLIRKHVSSYKDLPILIYHFSTKFRNELRAKSGILRGREFLMKDLYSAHATEKEMNDYYWTVAEAYLKIFKRMHLDAIIAEASGGVFTNAITHEFQVLSDQGEDLIYRSKNWKYAKNQEIMTDAEKNADDVEVLKSIEVGNIFRFGTNKYAELMNGNYTDDAGDTQKVWFGSYGIGTTRLIGVLTELFHDDKGIIWPVQVAPFFVHLIGLNFEDEEIKTRTFELYEKLKAQNIEVLFDDREDVSPGEKFADADLIGNPVRLVVSKRTEDKIEYKRRDSKDTELLSLDNILDKLYEIKD